METYGDTDVENPLGGSDVEHKANELIEKLGGYTRELDQRTRAFVREYPTAAVLGAVAMGFVLGRILVRR
jgi:hypothetical protein